MKKVVLFVLIALMAFAALPVMAQQSGGSSGGNPLITPGNESELYVFNLPVEKVFPYKKGYVVMYRKGANQVGTAYIPYDWFRFDVAKAQLVPLGDGPMWPSISIFMKEGKFHSVRLYVAKRQSHQTWGNIPSNVNIDDRFEGVEELDLNFDTGKTN